MSLSPKQEAFAAGVAQGLSQAEAYRRAYPRSSAWKDEAVWVCAECHQAREQRKTSKGAA